MREKKRFVSIFHIALALIVLYALLNLIVLEIVLHASLKSTFLKNSAIIKEEYIKIKKREIKNAVIKTIKFITVRYFKYRYKVQNTVQYKAFDLKDDIDNMIKIIGKKKFIDNIDLFVKDRFFYGYGRVALIKVVRGRLVSYGIDLSNSTKNDFMSIVGASNNFFIEGTTNKGKKIIGYAVFVPKIGYYVLAYLDLDRYERRVKDDILFDIVRTNGVVNKNYYIFINTTDGKAIITNNRIINNGKKLWQLSIAPKEARRVFDKELKAYNDGGGFIRYSWLEPKTGKVERKISYIGRFPQWNWIVGEGFYIDELDSVIGKINDKLKDNVLAIEKYFIVISLIGLFVVLVVYLLILKSTKSRVEKILDNIDKAFKDDALLRQEKYRIKEINKFVRYINLALIKFRDYENEFLEAFIKATEARDPYTKGHSQRVAFYSKIIARKLGFEEKKQEELYRAGLLHDIGKIGIPDNILLKPGRLTKNEYRIIQYHAVFSEQIVSNISRFRNIASYIRHHHERCDGSGYPDGLKCDEIEVEAKILAIADVFDALTSKRPYRDKLLPEDAIKIMYKDPLDHEILKKVEHELVSSCILEDNTNIDSKSEEVDKIRRRIFDIDYKTGLKRRRTLMENIKGFAENNREFAVFMVYLKDFTFLNYEFPQDAVDRVVYYTAEYLVKMLEDLGYSEEYISRAYEDAFLFIIPIENDKWFDFFETLKENIVKNLYDRLGNDDKIKKFYNERNENIMHFVRFDVVYTTYPYETNTFENLLYLLQLKRK